MTKNCPTCAQPIKDDEPKHYINQEIVGHAKCLRGGVMMEPKPCLHLNCHNMACDDCGMTFD